MVRTITKLRTIFFSLTLALILLATPSVAHALPFNTGDIFVSLSGGYLQHYNSSGTLLETLDSGLSGFGLTSHGEICQDPSGNVYATYYTGTAGRVAKWDTTSALVTNNFGAGNFATQETRSCEYRTTTGTLYFGIATSTGDPIELNTSGTFVSQPPVTSSSGHLDFDPTDCIIYYASGNGGNSVERYNRCTNTQLATFYTSGALDFIYGIDVLPDSRVLVASENGVTILSAAGAVLGTWALPGDPGVTRFFDVELDPNGTQFWATTAEGDFFYKYDLSPIGAPPVTTIDASPGSRLVSGLIVYSAAPTPTLTPYVIVVTTTPTPPGGSTFTPTQTITPGGPTLIPTNTPFPNITIVTATPSLSPTHTPTPPVANTNYIFVAVGDGRINIFDPSFTYVGSWTDPTYASSANNTGICVDVGGTLLYNSQLTADQMTKYNSSGVVQTSTFASTDNPNGCALDSSGNVFIGESFNLLDIKKYNSAGVFQTAYNVAHGSGGAGVQYMAMASDQCTIYYTSANTAVRRYNTCTNTQLPDFNIGIAFGLYGIRLLDDGTILVADRETGVFRLNASGLLIETYIKPGAETEKFYTLTVNDAQTKFYVSAKDIFGGTDVGMVYEYTIGTTGAPTGSFNSFTPGGSRMGDIKVFSDFGPVPTATPTLTPTVTLTPTPTCSGTQLTSVHREAQPWTAPGTYHIDYTYLNCGGPTQTVSTTVQNDPPLPFPLSISGTAVLTLNPGQTGTITYTLVCDNTRPASYTATLPTNVVPLGVSFSLVGSVNIDNSSCLPTTTPTQTLTPTPTLTLTRTPTPTLAPGCSPQINGSIVGTLPVVAPGSYTIRFQRDNCLNPPPGPMTSSSSLIFQGVAPFETFPGSGFHTYTTPGEIFDIVVSVPCKPEMGASWNSQFVHIYNNATGTYPGAAAIDNTACLAGTSTPTPSQTITPTTGAGFTIRGTVFEDITGDNTFDGDLILNDTSGDQRGRGGVNVCLFLDNGDNIPNAADVQISCQTTSTGVTSGDYTFGGLAGGTYWVAPQSIMVSPSAGGTGIAEQTMGPNGKLCNGVISVVGGTCYGGRAPATGDFYNGTSATLANVKSVSRVILSSDVLNQNFGFSFNVVTNVNDTYQGSLRQFIDNANAIPGANTMRFVPAVPANVSSGSDTWWRISPTTVLPTIGTSVSGNNTTIDGRAYSTVDGITLVNSNPAILNSGLTTGTGLTTLNAVDGPELQLNGQTSGLSTGLWIQGQGQTVSYMAFRGFGSADANFATPGHADIMIGQDSSTTTNTISIFRNVLGSDPNNFVSPGIINSSQGTGILVAGANDVSIFDNRIGFHGRSNIQFGYSDINNDNPENFLVRGNLIRSAGNVDGVGDAIKIAGYNGTVGFAIRDNYIDSAMGYGIDDVTLAGTGNVQNNTILNMGQGSTRKHGVHILKSTNELHTYSSNIFDSNGGAGIAVDDNGASNRSNYFFANSFQNNTGNAIDLSSPSSSTSAITVNDGICATGSNANNGVDYATITFASISAGNLTVYGNTTCSGVMQVYKEAAGSGDTLLGLNYGEGQALVGSFNVSPGSFTFTIPAGIVVVAGDRITSTLSDATFNTSEFSNGVVIQNNITPTPPAMSSTPTLTPIIIVVTTTPTPPGGLTFTPTQTITPGGPSFTPTETPFPNISIVTATPSVTLTPFIRVVTATPTPPGGLTFTPTQTITPGGPTLIPTDTPEPNVTIVTATPSPTLTGFVQVVTTTPTPPAGLTFTPTTTVTPGGPTLTPTDTPFPNITIVTATPSNTITLTPTPASCITPFITASILESQPIVAPGTFTLHFQRNNCGPVVAGETSSSSLTLVGAAPFATSGTGFHTYTALNETFDMVVNVPCKPSSPVSYTQPIVTTYGSIPGTNTILLGTLIDNSCALATTNTPTITTTPTITSTPTPTPFVVIVTGQPTVTPGGPSLTPTDTPPFPNITIVTTTPSPFVATSTVTQTPTPTSNFSLDDPTIFKSASNGSPVNGQTVVFTLTATNPGSSPTASNVTVFDPVPLPFIVKSATTDQGTLVISGQLVTFTLGILNPGQTVTMTVTTEVSGSITGPVTNVSTITGDQPGQPPFSVGGSVTVTVGGGNTGGGSTGGGQCTEQYPGEPGPSVFQVDRVCLGTSAKAVLHINPGSDPYTGFTIAYGPQPGSEDFNVSFDHGHSSGAITYTINDLDPKQTYYFKVRANNSCRSGGYSGALEMKSCISTRRAAPSGLTNVGALPQSGGSKSALFKTTKGGLPLPASGISSVNALAGGFGIISTMIGVMVTNVRVRKNTRNNTKIRIRSIE